MTTAMTTEKPKDFSQLTIRQVLFTEEFKQQIAQVLPKHMKPERMARVAVTALTRTPKLAECDQLSFLKCMMDLSAWGLEPDGRVAHLIPFWNGKRGCMECQLIIDYKGIVELIKRTGVVSYIHADLVCDKDMFDYDRGQLVAHKPNYREDRGPAYAVYALVRYKDNSEQCMVMNMDEVSAIRKRSKYPDKGPWATDFGEMAKKTVFKRLSKWISLSPEIRDVLDSEEDYIDAESTPAMTGPRPNVPGSLQALTDHMESQERGQDDNDENESGLEQGQYVDEGGEIQDAEPEQGNIEPQDQDIATTFKKTLDECRIMARADKAWENFKKYNQDDPDLLLKGTALYNDAKIRITSNKQKSLPGA